MNFYLFLCALGWHRWAHYRCKDSASERNTRRECPHCGAIQERDTPVTPWTTL